MKKKIVIIGGGFGGINAAMKLARADVEITLIDKRNFHLFQPLLYQVATGYLAPSDIASPIRAICSKYKNVLIFNDEVLDIDFASRVVSTNQNSIQYDYLIIATGVVSSYFGNDDWQELAPGLKTVEDASTIRGKILSSFEAAEQTNDVNLRNAHLTFCVIGAGPTGVEMAGAIAELARHTMKNDFRNFDPSVVRIILFEGGKRILSGFSESSSKYAHTCLIDLGIEVRLNCMVIKVEPEMILTKDQDGEHEIFTRNLIWAAGVKVEPLLSRVGKRLDLERDRIGRIKVNKFMNIPDYDNVFVIGDASSFELKNDKTLPGLAPVAIQQGSYVAKRIIRDLENKTTGPFRYLDKGNMAVIGKGKAVAETWKLRLTGLVAWLCWALIHIYFLIELKNRFIVFCNWTWHYITNKRGSRLIISKKDLTND
jgi:NADH dehydrogenase